MNWEYRNKKFGEQGLSKKIYISGAPLDKKITTYRWGNK